MGFAGEDHQADAVALQAVDQPGDGQFGPLEAVGRIIFRQHGVGDVEGDDHFHALALMFLEPCAELRPAQAQDEEEPGEGKQRDLEPALAGRGFGHQRGHQFRIAQPGDPPAAGTQIEGVRHEQQRNDQQQQQILTLCQIDHYGTLLKMTKRKSNSRSSAASAMSAKRMNSSE